MGSSRGRLRIVPRQRNAPGLPGCSDGRHDLAVEFERQGAGFARRDFKRIVRVELLHVIRPDRAIEDDLAIRNYLYVGWLPGMHLQREDSRHGIARG